MLGTSVTHTLDERSSPVCFLHSLSQLETVAVGRDHCLLEGNTVQDREEAVTGQEKKSMNEKLEEADEVR